MKRKWGTCVWKTLSSLEVEFLNRYSCLCWLLSKTSNKEEPQVSWAGCSLFSTIETLQVILTPGGNV